MLKGQVKKGGKKKKSKFILDFMYRHFFKKIWLQFKIGMEMVILTSQKAF